MTQPDKPTQTKPKPKPRKKKRSKLRRNLVLMALLLLVGTVVAASLLRNRDVVLTVQTEKVQRRDLTETVVATGRIHPVTRVVINPEVSGEIVELPVREGQRVKKGDLLVRIKPDNYIASRNSAEASYKSSLASQALSEANLARAEFEFGRAGKLAEDGLISESEYINAKTNFDVASASLDSSRHQGDQAKAALERAEEELGKTTIFAPMDGTVTQLKSEVGERVVGTAMMAGTEIMTVANLAAMEAWVDIGEIDIVSIAIGQKARLEVDAFRDETFGGTVTEIANGAKTSGMGSQQEATKFEVKIRVQDQSAFRPGMSVTANVETRYRTNVLTVPIQSVTTRMPKPKPKPDSGSKADPTSDPDSDADGEPAVDDDNGNQNGNNNDDAGTPTTPAVAENSGEGAQTKPTAESEGSVSGTTATSKKAKSSSAEGRKPVEVVFAVDNGKVKMIEVERGISDDDYTEIVRGLEEGMEIVSGGYRAINRDLEDGTAVRVGPAVGLGEIESENR